LIARIKERIEIFMVIYFKAGSELRQRLNPDVDEYTRRVETTQGKSVREILCDLGINPGLVAFIHIGGKIKGLDYVPEEGQSITLQPPVSGG
jgi:molybdopterin converting factor small subunit